MNNFDDVCRMLFYILREFCCFVYTIVEYLYSYNIMEFSTRIENVNIFVFQTQATKTILL